MTVTRGSYDLASAKQAHDDAETKATNYITKIDDAGITVHPYDDTNGVAVTSDRAVINTNGMTIYKDDTDVAFFGDTARVGKDGSVCVIINPDSFMAYNEDGVPFFTVDYDAGQITFDKKNGIATTITKSRTTTINGNETDKTLLSISTKQINIAPLEDGDTINYNYASLTFNSGTTVSSTIYMTDIVTQNNGLQFSTYSSGSNHRTLKFTITPTNGFSDFVKGTSFEETKSMTVKVKKISDDSDVGTVTFYMKLSYDASDNHKLSLRTYVSSSFTTGSLSLGGHYYQRIGYYYITSIVTTAPALIFGTRSNETVIGGYSSTMGLELVAEQQNQLVAGKFNDNQTDTAFEIGNGTADDDRSNALTVDWDGNVEASGDITCSNIGDRKNVYGNSSTSNVNNSAGVYVTIGVLEHVPNGLWMVNCRARFVPNTGTTGNNYPAIYITTNSSGEGWHQRTYTAGTTNAQLNATEFLELSDANNDNSIYLRGTNNQAGYWTKQNAAQFIIDAIRIK